MTNDLSTVSPQLLHNSPAFCPRTAPGEGYRAQGTTNIGCAGVLQPDPLEYTCVYEYIHIFAGPLALGVLDPNTSNSIVVRPPLYPSPGGGRSWGKKRVSCGQAVEKLWSPSRSSSMSVAAFWRLLEGVGSRALCWLMLGPCSLMWAKTEI